MFFVHNRVHNIRSIADQVQSMERLRQLLVLTVADIRAVGPKTWNGWKAQLLRERDRWSQLVNAIGRIMNPAASEE
mgnify:CR=1 FL=1